MNWDYLQPVKIRFGKGRIAEVKELAKEMGIKNGILVADPFFFTNELAEKIIKESDGMIITSFGKVSPNPDVTEVDACADVIREKKNWVCCGAWRWKCHGLCKGSGKYCTDRGFYPQISWNRSSNAAGAFTCDSDTYNSRNRK